MRRCLFCFLGLPQAIHDQFLQATDAFFFLQDIALLLQYIFVRFQDHRRFFLRALSNDDPGSHLIIPVVIVLALLLIGLMRSEFLQYGAKAHVILAVQALLKTRLTKMLLVIGVIEGLLDSD